MAAHTFVEQCAAGMGDLASSSLPARAFWRAVGADLFYGSEPNPLSTVSNTCGGRFVLRDPIGAQICPADFREDLSHFFFVALFTMRWSTGQIRTLPSR